MLLVGADEPFSSLWSQRPVSAIGWCRCASQSLSLVEGDLVQMSHSLFCGLKRPVSVVG